MPSQPAIPPLLCDHFRPTHERSLVLITSVLGASANWILLRQVHAALRPKRSVSDHQTENVAVVFVTWLRGIEFWNDGAKKLGFSFVNNQSITFIDALQSGLGLHDDEVNAAEKVFSRAIKELKAVNNQVLLVLDAVDFLLAATETTVGEVLDMIWELRELVQSTIISVSADYPLLHTQSTPLESSHAAFVMSLTHQANTMWSARELDTGSAKDVSGVLRITEGPAAENEELEGGHRIEEKEVLYFVAGDGGVKAPSTDMTKGTSSFGKRHNKTHTLCRRCGRRSLHIQKHTCSSCGYPAAKIRQYNWGMKAKRRKTTGTGRMRSLKEVPRKFKNGFQTGAPKGSKGPGVKE
ncbi:MAG: hypothetical protein Q9220_006832 [cf. Caloplaca sp. 1 TL-2023]